jgi:hypothetical protein
LRLEWTVLQNCLDSIDPAVLGGIDGKLQGRGTRPGETNRVAAKPQPPHVAGSPPLRPRRKGHRWQEESAERRQQRPTSLRHTSTDSSPEDRVGQPGSIRALQRTRGRRANVSWCVPRVGDVRSAPQKPLRPQGKKPVTLRREIRFSCSTASRARRAARQPLISPGDEAPVRVAGRSHRGRGPSMAQPLTAGSTTYRIVGWEPLRQNVASATSWHRVPGQLGIGIQKLTTSTTRQLRRHDSPVNRSYSNGPRSNVVRAPSPTPLRLLGVGAGGSSSGIRPYQIPPRISVGQYPVHVFTNYIACLRTQ